MPRPRLNLFALPSQTSILFYLLMVVLWGAIGINLFGAQVIPLWPLGVLLLILPFYGFLLRPDIEKNKYALCPPLEGEYPRLVGRIAEVARQINLPRAPIVWIDRHRSQPVYSLGTFRRWYIVFSPAQAQTLEDLLSNPATAIQADVQILHELYHFRNGDIWQLGLLVELFRYSFLIMGWALLFLLGWGLVLVLAKGTFLQFSTAEILTHLPAETRTSLEPLLLAAFPSPQELNAVQEKARSIDLGLVLQFILNLTLPYVVFAAFLWLFYRPLLWQAREYYADAGVFQVQKNTVPFLKFILVNKKTVLHDNGRGHHHAGRLRWLLDGWNRVRKFFKGEFWPDFGLRWRAFQLPQAVFYDWKKITWILGGLALSLEIFLATPLTLPLHGANPLMFPTLIVLAGMAYFLLPKIVLADHAWRDGLKVLGGITLLRATWMLLTLTLLWSMYLIFPNILFQVLQSAIYSTARYVGISSLLELDLLEFLVTASWRNLAQIPLVFVIQVFGFAFLLFVFRRILAWYGLLTTHRRFQRVILLAVTGICLVSGTLILPVSMSILLWQNPSFGSILFGFLIMLLFGGWFYMLDQRYHARCPACQVLVKQSTVLGAICESCGNSLLPWLVSDEG